MIPTTIGFAFGSNVSIKNFFSISGGKIDLTS